MTVHMFHGETSVLTIPVAIGVIIAAMSLYILYHKVRGAATSLSLGLIATRGAVMCIKSTFLGPRFTPCSSTIPYVAVGTRKGNRPNNEDAALALILPSIEGGGAMAVLAVADGVGGAEKGEVASEVAVRKILDFAWALRRMPTERELHALAQFMHEEIRALLKGRGGTTLSAAFLDLTSNRGLAVTVGDSELWKVGPGGVSRLSISDRVGPQVISQALGINLIGPHVLEISASPGEFLIAVTDGVADAVGENLAVLLYQDMQIADPNLFANVLLDAAEKASSRDNMTVAILYITRPSSL